MSAFLGPIHYWLYNKIKLQEELVFDILQTAAEKGWLSVSTQTLDAACGKLDLLPLEDVIDGTNIHGWLHARIGLTESRLAFLVTQLLTEDASRVDDIMQTAHQFGENHAMPHGIGADEAYKTLEDTLLDGMPCDHVNHVLEREATKVIWQKIQCVHTEYWEQVGGNIKVFDGLRGNIIAGMLAHSDLEFHALGNDVYEISRKG